MRRLLRYNNNLLDEKLANILPEKSVDIRYKVVGNCAEVDAVNKALIDGAKMDNLVLYTYDIINDIPKGMCENCIFTFRGRVLSVLSEVIGGK